MRLQVGCKDFIFDGDYIEAKDIAEGHYFIYEGEVCQRLSTVDRGVYAFGHDTVFRLYVGTIVESIPEIVQKSLEKDALDNITPYENEFVCEGTVLLQDVGFGFDVLLDEAGDVWTVQYKAHPYVYVEFNEVTMHVPGDTRVCVVKEDKS